MQGWQFWIDRGGTFTDIVACRPDGQISTHKLLSENPERYDDAVIYGIREILGFKEHASFSRNPIVAIKMGTTVATNALLERKGEPTVLVITQGLGDALRIGYQNRPQIFARQIVLPEMLYQQVIEVEERLSATGEVLCPLNLTDLRQKLQATYLQGIRACAIVLIHAYRYPDHECRVAELAAEIGFSQISVSHRVSPLIKLISRGDTTVVDAYLSPILQRYVAQVSQRLSDLASPTPPQLLFMQSHGGLVEADRFQGKDSILSGPAGGIVGAVATSLREGLNQIISFDMGGTSTDVAHYAGEYERQFETEVAGVRLRTPMMAIQTIAAGGGSILQFDGNRYLVGPESAAANPGPACYRKGGPLTVTDCNVMLGKLQPDFFPALFGPQGNLPLDRAVVQQRFQHLMQEINSATGKTHSPEQVAAGFLTIAVEKMAGAIQKISLQRGYDLANYTLCCFGGAGGQHACLLADVLGIRQIFLHPYAGVLSAYGMGLAEQRVLRERSLEVPLTEAEMPALDRLLAELTTEALAEQPDGSQQSAPVILRRLHLRYQSSDSTLIVPYADWPTLRAQFDQLHHQRYGFVSPEKMLVVAIAAVEVIYRANDPTPELPLSSAEQPPPHPVAEVEFYSGDRWHLAAVFDRQDLRPGDQVIGPAIITEPTGTNVIEPGWSATLTVQGGLLLSRLVARALSPGEIVASSELTNAAIADPMLLELFNYRFQAIAEQMGFTLQNTSASVNIKERLDFSCAIFDGQGDLVANAPHIPVHLGSMGESVKALLQDLGNRLRPGDVYASNNPYNGGTHLPDITVITPVFFAEHDRPLFFVASRGHHADIGGISPGSMPPYSTTVEQEGVLFDQFLLVQQGQFRETALAEHLKSAVYPARNPSQNIADLRSQIAANEKGVQELRSLVVHYGLTTVQAYMGHVQHNAEVEVKRVIARLLQAHPQPLLPVSLPLDNGGQICVRIDFDPQALRARIDFQGTSPQQPGNFNAPLAVCKAAVLYVFRTLVAKEIPLNAGCLKPLDIIVPVGSLLNPRYPAAVVAGNVETSQVVVDALYLALGVLAGSQGTMNNLTFGDDRHQYYETICGGAGAGPDFRGADAVQTHMTNSRLTDPEVLELRFPVVLEQFALRPHSGGQGKQRGGHGVIRCLRFRHSMTAGILANRRCTEPPGLAGGQPGARGSNRIERADGQVEWLESTALRSMHPGDALVVETPGGGGYGGV